MSIEMMKQLEINNKFNASLYLELYHEYAEDFKTKDHGFIGSRWKPVSITDTWLFEKLEKANNILKNNYWQMSYEQAKLRYRHLPFATWERGVKRYEKI